MIHLPRLTQLVQLVDPQTGTATNQGGQAWDALAKAIEALEAPLPALADVPGGGTLADVITALNTLLQNLRDAGRMTP